MGVPGCGAAGLGLPMISAEGPGHGGRVPGPTAAPGRGAHAEPLTWACCPACRAQGRGTPARAGCSPRALAIPGWTWPGWLPAPGSPPPPAPGPGNRASAGGSAPAPVLTAPTLPQTAPAGLSPPALETPTRCWDCRGGGEAQRKWLLRGGGAGRRWSVSACGVASAMEAEGSPGVTAWVGTPRTLGTPPSREHVGARSAIPQEWHVWEHGHAHCRTHTRATCNTHASVCTYLCVEPRMTNM